MEPSLSVSFSRVEQFRMDRECPISNENMTQAATLMPCAHTFDERSLWSIPGFVALDDPHQCLPANYPACPGEGNRVTKARIITHITCPICRHPVEYYYRNWALRSVCLDIPKVFQPIEENKGQRPVVVPQPLEARPRNVQGLEKRFIIAVSTALYSITLGACHMMEIVPLVPVRGGFWDFYRISYDPTDRHNATLLMLGFSVFTATCTSVAVYFFIRR